MNNLLYYDWVSAERQRLQDKYLQMLSAEAVDQSQDKNYLLAIDLMNQAIQLDPLCENYYCLAMDCYAALQDRGGLIRCYQLLTQNLQDAFNMPPSAHSEQHYKRVLTSI